MNRKINEAAMSAEEREIVECKTVTPKVQVTGSYAGLVILKVEEKIPTLVDGVYLAVGSTVIDGPYKTEDELKDRLDSDAEYRMAMAITAATNNVMLIIKEDEKGKPKNNPRMGNKGRNTNS